MARLLPLILSVFFLAGPASAQIPANPMAPENCFMCPAPGPPAGTFSDRHYQRQQRTQSFSAPPSVPSYDYGYTPGQNPYDQSLNDQSFRSPSMSNGAEYWWPTPQQQMQSDRNAIEEYNAGYGMRSRQPCKAWSMQEC